MHYRAPNRRLIPRADDGRFTRQVLDCRVCDSCGAIHPAEMVNVGNEAFPFLQRRIADVCRECGEPLKEPR